jgi:hypothetical protein
MSSSETRISSTPIEKIKEAAGEARLGRLRRVDPGEIWPDAGDLTPWLRTNPELIGEALRLEIRAAETYDLDEAIGELTAGVPVIVKARAGDLTDEDQRDLAAYVAELEAGVLVLLSKTIPADARERVDKLNRNTTRTIVFYGVEFDLWQIDDSAPAPQFRVVAGPTGWDQAPARGASTQGSQPDVATTLAASATNAGSSPDADEKS